MLRVVPAGCRSVRRSRWPGQLARLAAPLPSTAARLFRGGATQFLRLPARLPELPGRALPKNGLPEDGLPEDGLPEDARPWLDLPRRGVSSLRQAIRDRRAGRAGRRGQQSQQQPRRAAWPVRIAASCAWLLAGLVLFSCYLHVSRTVPVNSDGASNVLQAWDMLHGNPLLRGWVLSDVSFYTTELPQYMVIELARGLTPDVVHIAAAITYTMLVLLAARLAKGGARGMLGLLRVAVAAGIMIAPLQSSAHVLLLEPDHVGSAVPVLLVLLLLDRAGRRWFVPPLVFLCWRGLWWRIRLC